MIFLATKLIIKESAHKDEERLPTLLNLLNISEITFVKPNEAEIVFIHGHWEDKKGEHFDNYQLIEIKDKKKLLDDLRSSGVNIIIT